MITPTVFVFPLARLRAMEFGWYPNSLIACLTFWRVCGDTSATLLTTRETVLIETFESFATSLIVATGISSELKVKYNTIN
jgi:hypothetical protein